jgi:hypothetical protein
MPAPSPLAIATGSLNRLVKEEQSYYKELEKQQTRLQKLKEGADEDGNKEYMIKQEVRLLRLPIHPLPLFFYSSNVHMLTVRCYRRPQSPRRKPSFRLSS